MSEYKHTLLALIAGAGYGLLGYAVGIMFLIGNISLASSLRYAVVSVVSGAVSFQLAETSVNGYSIVIAITSGLFLFFVIKIAIFLLFRLSNEPDTALTKIAEIIKSFKK